MEFLAAAHAVNQAWPWFWPLCGGALGAVFGSFLGCALYRVPRGLSLRHPPSQCMSCGTRLTVPDLVPILSYLFLRGKCRHCGARIPLYGTLVEAGCTATGILLAYFLSR